MPNPSATVRFRQVTTTTNATTSTSVLIINTGYLKTKPGILKLFIVILSLITFILVLTESHSYAHYYGKSSGFYSSDLFLLLISFEILLVTALMLIASLLSLSTSSLLSKISFDFIYHFTQCVLAAIAGTWILVRITNSGQDLKQHSKIVAAAVISLVLCLLHFIHGILSYRTSSR